MSVLQDLSALELSGLVRVAQVTPDLEYLFRHALVQEAAYTSLLESDQQRLHQAVGEALELMYANQLEKYAPELAQHFEKGGDLARALRYYRLAAGAALARYANQEAESHFRSGLRWAQDETQQADLLSGLGEAQYRQSRYEDAIQTWMSSIGHNRSLGRADVAASLYARAGRAAWFGGDVRRGLEICQQGVSALPGVAEGPGLAQLIHELARAYYFNGQSRDALTYCRHALEMAERLGAVDVQADALTTLGILPGVTANESRSALERAVELAEGAGLLAIAGRAHINLGSVYRGRNGELPTSLRHFLRSAELAQQRGAVQEELLALLAAASNHVQSGDVQAAQRIVETMRGLLNQVPDRATIEMEISVLSGVLDGLAGNWQAVIAASRQASEYFRQRGDLQNLISAQMNLATAAMELSRMGEPLDWVEAEAALEEVIEIVDRSMWNKSQAFSLMAVMRVYQGRLEEARRWLENAHKLLRPDMIGDDINMLVAQAELALAEQRWLEAIESLESLSHYSNGVSRWLWGRMLMLWAEALMGRGDAADLEQAQVLLLEAQELFTRMQAPRYLALVQERVSASRTQTFAQARQQKKVAQELAFAGRLQGGFLPAEPPDLPGWQIAAALKSARETTGDFYDFILLPGGQIGIVIADVADKGIGAALYMASTRTLLRAYAEEFPDNPGRALAAANHRITSDTRGGLFVTLFYGLLDPASGRLSYCNAGHSPPLLLTAGGRLTKFERTGVPLGIFDDATWQVIDVDLPPGAVLILYTDGMTEAQNEQEELFGEDRLGAALRRAASQVSSARALRDALLASVDSFVGLAPQSDDTTLVVFKRE